MYPDALNHLETPISKETIIRDPLEPEFRNATVLDIYKRSKELREQRVTGITSTSSSTAILDFPQIEDIQITLLQFAKQWNADYWFEHQLGLEAQLIFRIATSSPNALQDVASQKDSTYELISYIGTQLNVPFTDKLAERLRYLVEVSEEEYPEQAPISPQSLRDFRNYLESMPTLAYPEVVLTPPGNIRAQWRRARNQHFAVEFLGNGDVRFVVFAHDSKRPYKTNRVSGLASMDSLMDLVEPYDVLRWASRSGESGE